MSKVSEIKSWAVKMGPLLLTPCVYKTLKNHVQLYCNQEQPREITFLLLGRLCGEGEAYLVDDVIFIPFGASSTHVEFRISDIVAIDRQTQHRIVAHGHLHTGDSVEGSNRDKSTSVLIDLELRRPIFHVILNRNMEFEVYDNSLALPRLFRPVTESIEDQMKTEENKVED